MTSKPTHTPGPWRASTMEMEARHWAKLHSGKHPIDVVLRGSDVIAAVWCGDDKDGEEPANARLIAAAPDMLEALEVARVDLRKSAYHARNSLDREALNATADRIDATIAKARGE